MYDARGETMTDEKRHVHPSRINRKRPEWLEKLSSPKQEAAIRKEAERIRNSSEPIPTVEEVRAMMDEALGGRTLKEVLRELDGREDLSDPSS